MAVREKVPEGTFSLIPQNTWKEWIWYIEAWLVIGIGSIPAPDLFQRGLSARNESVAQWSAYLAGAMYLTVGMIPVLLGIIGAVVIPGIEDPEFILPALGLKYLHPVMMAVFVGALFSALMSSADSGLLAPASIFGQNVLRHLKKDLSQEQLLMSVRWAVLGAGFVSMLTALYFENVYDLMVNSWAVLMVSLFVPLTAGLYWRRANGRAVVASIFVGMSSWVLLAWVQSSYPADLMATGLGALTLVGVSLASGGSDPPRPLVDSAGRPVAYRDRLGLLGLSSDDSVKGGYRGSHTD
jgi:Na+/proline symporter